VLCAVTFFHSNFFILTEMLRRDLTFSDKIALLENNIKKTTGGDN
jgi:hypothetical protein